MPLNQYSIYNFSPLSSTNHYPNRTMKKRDLSLDIIRILACCMVVFMHSPIPSTNAPGPFLTALSYITAPCIGLFFMVSGALLLPVKIDYFSFLKQRLSKIILPTLAWTAIYLTLKIYYSESEINVMQSILSIPFTAQGHGVLWFMYTLTGLYLIAPILSAWLEKASTNEIQFILMLWCITLCYPIIENYLSIETGTTGILYYFTGYAGYFILGYYLKHRTPKIPIIIPLAIAIVGFGLILILKRYNISFDFYSLFGYTSIFIVALCYLIWRTIVCLVHMPSPNKTPSGEGGITRFINRLSSITFGIYLTHILIMRYWLWKTEWIQQISNYQLQTLVIALLTLSLSAIA